MHLQDASLKLVRNPQPGVPHGSRHHHQSRFPRPLHDPGQRRSHEGGWMQAPRPSQDPGSGWSPAWPGHRDHLRGHHQPGRPQAYPGDAAPHHPHPDLRRRGADDPGRASRGSAHRPSHRPGLGSLPPSLRQHRLRRGHGPRDREGSGQGRGGLVASVLIDRRVEPSCRAHVARQLFLFKEKSPSPDVERGLGGEVKLTFLASYARIFLLEL